LAQLLGVVEELAREGFSADINVIGVGTKVPNDVIRRQLKLNETENVFAISRLIFANQQPLALDHSYFTQTIGQLLGNTDLSRDLIYTQLELYGYKISHGEQSISAGRASQEEAKYLLCQVNSPVLVVKRTTFVEGGLPIDYSVSIYRGDRYQYHVDLKRHANGN
jgi:GntR family transcriptional regulator